MCPLFLFANYTLCKEEPATSHRGVIPFVLEVVLDPQIGLTSFQLYLHIHQAPAITLSWEASQSLQILSDSKRDTNEILPCTPLQGQCRLSQHFTTPYYPQTSVEGERAGKKQLPRSIQTEIKGLQSSEVLPLKGVPSEQESGVGVTSMALPVANCEAEKDFAKASIIENEF